MAPVSVITVWTILDGNCGSLNKQTTLSFSILALISVILFGVGEISGFSAIEPTEFKEFSFSKYWYASWKTIYGLSLIDESSFLIFLPFSFNLWINTLALAL